MPWKPIKQDQMLRQASHATDSAVGLWGRGHWSGDCYQIDKSEHTNGVEHSEGLFARVAIT